MPSVTATVIQWLLRTTGTYKKMFSGGPGFAEIQAQALSVPSAPSEKNRKACAISFSEFQGRAVWTFDPKDGAAKGTMLYWHGGGYVYPASEAHWDYLAYLAATHGIRSVAPLYPLAPMDEVGAITGFALDFYRNFVAAQAGAPFTMGGDSAGGGLTAATVMGARDAGLAIQTAPMILEGGAVDGDGTGLVAVTEQCLLNPNRNPAWGQASIERELKDHLGADTVIWLNRGVDL